MAQGSDLSHEDDLAGSEEEVVAPRRVVRLDQLAAPAPPPAAPSTARGGVGVGAWVVAAVVLLGLAVLAVVVVAGLGGLGWWAATQAAG